MKVSGALSALSLFSISISTSTASTASTASHRVTASTASTAYCTAGDSVFLSNSLPPPPYEAVASCSGLLPSAASFPCPFSSSPIPLSRLEDGVCDCCDGSDEPGGGCGDTCGPMREAQRKEAAARKAKRDEGLKAVAALRASWEEESSKRSQERSGKDSRRGRIEALTLAVSSEEAAIRSVRAGRYGSALSGVDLPPVASMTGSEAARATRYLAFAAGGHAPLGRINALLGLAGVAKGGGSDDNDMWRLLARFDKDLEALRVGGAPEKELKERGNKRAALERHVRAYAEAPVAEGGDRSVDAFLMLAAELQVGMPDIGLAVAWAKGGGYFLDQEGFDARAAGGLPGVEERLLEAADPKRADGRGFGGFWPFERAGQDDPARKILEGLYEAKRQEVLDPEPASKEDLKEAEDEYTALLNAEKAYEVDLERFGGGMEHLISLRACVEGDDGKYTYNFCGFEKIEQREGNSRAVILGKYMSHEALPDGSLVVKFGMGDRCWGHGERRANAKVACGPETKVLSVVEPNTCVYEVEMEGPAGCGEVKEEVAGERHDEL